MNLSLSITSTLIRAVTYHTSLLNILYFGLFFGFTFMNLIFLKEKEEKKRLYLSTFILFFYKFDNFWIVINVFAVLVIVIFTILRLFGSEKKKRKEISNCITYK